MDRVFFFFLNVSLQRAFLTVFCFVFYKNSHILKLDLGDSFLLSGKGLRW